MTRAPTALPSDVELVPPERSAIVVGDLVFDTLRCGPEDGELVLLLHGFPQTERMWAPVLAALGAAGWHAVAPRQRGYAAGARPRGRSAYAIGSLTADVDGMATALGAERFHLVGHDWGGIIGWVLAATEASRLRSFCSLATPHPAAIASAMVGPQALRSAYAALFQVPGLPEAVLGAGHRQVLRLLLERSGLPAGAARTHADELDGSALHAALQWYRATNPLRLARTPATSVPTRFIWGNRDVALGRAAAEATQDHALGPYRFDELDAPHWLVESQTEAVVALVADHLTEHAARPA